METWKTNHPPLYNARWASQKELQFLAPKPFWYDLRRYKYLQRLYFLFRWVSKPIHHGYTANGRKHFTREPRENNNVLVVGRSGSGKTSSIMLNSILRTTEGSLVVTGARELHTLTSGILKKRGYKVFHLDVLKNKSDSFNDIDDLKDRSEIRIYNSTIFDAAGVTGENSQFWKNNSASIGDPLMDALKNQPEAKYKTMAQYRKLFLEFTYNPKAIDDFVARYASPEMFAEYRSFIQSDPKVIKNTLSTIKSALNIFGDEKIQRLTSSNNIPRKRLRKEKIALFFTIPEGQVSKYKQVISLFILGIFKEILRDEELDDCQHVSLILDELTNSSITDIPTFLDVATQIRKHNGSFLACIQDHSQLRTLGQDGMATFMNGAIQHEIILPSMSLETAEYVERLLGKTSRVFTDQVAGQTQEAIRSIATASEIRLYPKNCCILIAPSIRPALLQLFPYYNNKWLKRLTKHEPVPITNPFYQRPLAFMKFKQYQPQKSSREPLD